MHQALPENLRLPLPAGDFLPHRPPMQLVDHLLNAADGSGTVEVNPGPGCPLSNSAGELDAVTLIELVAQSYAAVQGYDDLRAGRPAGQGFLVGIRRAQLFASSRCGERLLVEVRTVARLDAFAMVEGEVRAGERLLASAAIKLWLPGVTA